MRFEGRFFYSDTHEHGHVNHMPPKFEIYKDAADKFRFRLRAQNGEIIATGEAYEQHAGVLKGVKSVQKNSTSEIEDLTTEEAQKIPNPKYQLLKDESGKFRFNLKAGNGEIIAQSEGYETKDGCMNGIEAVKESANAEIEDQTATEETTETAAAETQSPAEPAAETKKTHTTAMPEKTVFVGKKPPMDYVLAIITGLSASNIVEITLKARGQAITTAVDAAEITRRRFLKDLKINKISIGTEQMPPREGETKPRSVSTIEIVVTKG